MVWRCGRRWYEDRTEGCQAGSVLCRRRPVPGHGRTGSTSACVDPVATIVSSGATPGAGYICGACEEASALSSWAHRRHRPDDSRRRLAERAVGLIGSRRTLADCSHTGVVVALVDQSNSPWRMAVVKAVQAWGVRVSVASVGCLESRTATAPSRKATSTQFALAEL